MAIGLAALMMALEFWVELRALISMVVVPPSVAGVSVTEQADHWPLRLAE